jgi:hypothetical protein
VGKHTGVFFFSFRFFGGLEYVGPVLSSPIQINDERDTKTMCVCVWWEAGYEGRERERKNKC